MPEGKWRTVADCCQQHQLEGQEIIEDDSTERTRMGWFPRKSPQGGYLLNVCVRGDCMDGSHEPLLDFTL